MRAGLLRQSPAPGRWSFSPTFCTPDLVSQQTLSVCSMPDTGGISCGTCSGQKYRSISQGMPTALPTPDTQRPGKPPELVWAGAARRHAAREGRPAPAPTPRFWFRPQPRCRPLTSLRSLDQPLRAQDCGHTSHICCHFSVSSRDAPGWAGTWPVSLASIFIKASTRPESQELR